MALIQSPTTWTTGFDPSAQAASGDLTALSDGLDDAEDTGTDRRPAPLQIIDRDWFRSYGPQGAKAASRSVKG